jgi:hypothetical protein
VPRRAKPPPETPKPLDALLIERRAQRARPDGGRGDESESDEVMVGHDPLQPSLRLSPESSPQRSCSHLASLPHAAALDKVHHRDESGAGAALDSGLSPAKSSRRSNRHNWSDSDEHASGEGAEEDIVGTRYSSEDDEDDDDPASMVGFAEKLPLMRRDSGGLFYGKGKAHQVASKIRRCSLGLRHSLIGAVNLLNNGDDPLQRYADLLEQQKRLLALDANDLDDSTIRLLRNIKDELARLEGRPRTPTPEPQSPVKENEPEIQSQVPVVTATEHEASELPTRPEVRSASQPSPAQPSLAQPSLAQPSPAQPSLA